MNAIGQTLEGKTLALKIKEELKKEVAELKEKFNCAPLLSAVQIGDNPSAEVYFKSQKKCADELGVLYQRHQLPADIAQDEFFAFLDSLNKDKNVSAVFVQMPLPKQIDARQFSGHMFPDKDAEGMHPENLGRLFFGKARIIPCTAAAVMELLKSTGVNLYGKEAVIVGHSEIVGKPLSLLLLEQFATTSVCHIATGERGLTQEHVGKAEVLVVAVGRAHLIKGSWIKEGAIVVDVGINKLGDKIVGDVEFEEAAKRASWITPVPGGVGPLTVTMLMRNLIEAAKLKIK
ncbi:bifunctional 5,10-methylenetetrahydrofolate dehydrogenase/5,10-methenyltetrahydrofolate cyclohydrolase [bacterium]|nr:MAG: bifunctional 5,10-methylenetetrahydrofolate dehydrogenase/5,10-methenyltetrahydrofolate cyclohydrolase [bacterium]